MPPDFHPQLIAFDLDGTLAESKRSITAEMGAVLEKLLQHKLVAVMSGAAFHQFEKQFLPAIPRDARLDHLYLFPTNAAQCWIFAEGMWEPEYDHAFTDTERAKIMHALKISMIETGFEELPEHVWGERIEDRGAQITFSALGQEAPIEEKKKYDPTREKRRPLYEALLARLPDFSIGLNAATSIDITRKGITKAFGIRELSRITDIPIAEMLYIGDALGPGGNDSVVIETGVPTREVKDVHETLALIKSMV
jgi:phosphomannomutase